MRLQDRTWTVLGILITLVLVAADRIVDASETTATEAVHALREARFLAPMPLDVDLGGPRVDSYRDVVTVSFADLRDVGRAHGGLVVIMYEVHPSEESAVQKFRDSLSSIEDAIEAGKQAKKGTRYAVFLPRPSDIDRLPLDVTNYCVTDGGMSYCQFVTGLIFAEVASRIPTFVEGEPDYLPELTRAALQHLYAVLD